MILEATVYGLRCGELGDVSGEKHDFVLASDYDSCQDRAEAAQTEAEQLRAALVRAVQISQGLFAMIDRETWKATGGDDMQGHYEGDYHAEQVRREIEEWAALAAGLP